MPVHAAFLKYFDEVCRCGSIRLAARRLYVASSAVNRQILKIEDELGVKLFERSASGIRPTEAGELLASHVRRTLVDAERTLADIKACAGGAHETITIAGQESVIARFLPPALRELHAAYPQIATAFKAAGGRQLDELLRSGGADIAIEFDPEPDSTIEFVAECRLPVGAIMAASHPLASRDSVALQDCTPYPVVLPDRSWPLRALLDREIGQAGIELNIVTSSNSVEFLRSMLDQPLVIGLQTVVGVEAKLDRGECVHIALLNPAPVTQRFVVCARMNRPDSAPMRLALALLGQRLQDYTG